MYFYLSFSSPCLALSISVFLCVCYMFILYSRTVFPILNCHFWSGRSFALFCCFFSLYFALSLTPIEIYFWSHYLLEKSWALINIYYFVYAIYFIRAFNEWHSPVDFQRFVFFLSFILSEYIFGKRLKWNENYDRKWIWWKTVIR